MIAREGRMQREGTLSARARVDRVSAPGALHVQSWLGGVIALVFLLMGYRPCPLSYRGFFA
jgi:hypothetical protein